MNGNHEPSVAPRGPDAALEIPAVSEPRASSKAARDEAFEALLVAASRAQQAAAPRRGANGAE